MADTSRARTARPEPDPPSSAPDPTAPWGSYRPRGAARLFTRLSRSVPALPLVKQLAFPLRRLARRRMGALVDARLWGHRLRFRPRGNISEGRLLFMPRSWDRRERALLAAFAHPGTVMVDVGANFGAYTWWLLHLLRSDCRILALEPEPQLNRRLRFNLETNGWDNVAVLPVAAGDEEGHATLHVHGDNLGQNTLADPDAGHRSESGGRDVRVRIQPLAAVLAEAGVERVDILKIDIEGLEPRVLGRYFGEAPATLWPRLLLCEFRDTPEYAELRTHLARLGYQERARTGLNVVLVRED